MKKRFIFTTGLMLAIALAFTVTAYAGTENVEDAAALKEQSQYEYYGALLAKNGIVTDGWMIADVISKGQAMEQQVKVEIGTAGGSNDDYFYDVAKKFGIDTESMAFDEVVMAVKEAEAAYYNANAPQLSEEEEKALYEKQVAEKMAQCNIVDPNVTAVREDMITVENIAQYRDTLALLGGNTAGMTDDEILRKTESLYEYYSAIFNKNGISIEGCRITDVMLKGHGMEQQADQPVDAGCACNDYFYEAAKKFGINTEGMTFNEVEIAVKEAEVAYNNANSPELSAEEEKALYEKQIAVKTDAMNK